MTLPTKGTQELHTALAVLARRLAQAPTPDWSEAACAAPGVDPNWWYASLVDPNGGEDQLRARTVCMACPLQRACVEYAIAVEEPAGIWGGATPEDRKPTLGRGCGRKYKGGREEPPTYWNEPHMNQAMRYFRMGDTLEVAARRAGTTGRALGVTLRRVIREQLEATVFGENVA